jgi:hypothetical protein
MYYPYYPHDAWAEEIRISQDRLNWVSSFRNSHASTRRKHSNRNHISRIMKAKHQKRR